ncbi:MAG: hypothetical protein EBX39_09530 [Actinobacteria bacterium]|nr:hypothetical protein [Actinomycetota bacterium]
MRAPRSSPPRRNAPTASPHRSPCASTTDSVLITPLLAPDTSLLDVAPASIALSALKPAEDGDGMVLRVLNPDDGTVEASVGFAVAIGEVSPVRLDETPSEEPFEFEGTRLRFPIGPHRLRSFRIRPA